MKRLLLSLAATAALIASPAVVVAGDVPIYGVWVRDGHPTDKLEFYDCAGKLCARGVQPMPDGSPAPEILRKAAKTSPNNWKGDLFNPEDGKTYIGKIAYEPPDQFTMTGCLIAFLCQSETWTRVSGPPKAAKPDAKADAADDKPAAKTPAADAKAGADKAAAKTAGAGDAPKAAAKPAKPAADAKAAAKPAPAKPKAEDDEAN